MTAAPQLPAPFVLRFLEPAIAPLAGRPVQLLVVSPGHPTHTLAVYDPAKKQVVRHVGPDGDWSRVAALLAMRVLAYLTPQDRELASLQATRLVSRCSDVLIEHSGSSEGLCLF